MNTDNRFTISRTDNFLLTILGIVLLIASASKILTVTISSLPVMANPDPIVGINNRLLFGLLGATELVSSFVVLYSKHVRLKLFLCAILFGAFTAYHIAIALGGASTDSCPCFGTILQPLGIPDTVVHQLAIAIAIAGAASSYYLLFKHTWQKRLFSSNTNDSHSHALHHN